MIACMGTGVEALNCTTAENSPTQEQANALVSYIREKGVRGIQCESTCSAGDGRCTQMHIVGDSKSGGRAMICGECHKSTPCSTAGSALNEVLSQCVLAISNAARVAGTQQADELEVIIEKIP
ncbi:unnamed protein product [Calypogeia fissa]